MPLSATKPDNARVECAPTLRIDRRSKLAALAERLRQLQTARRGSLSRCPTGLPELDAALGGGFARGCVHELLAPDQRAPARSLALLAAKVAAGGSPAATGFLQQPRSAGPFGYAQGRPPIQGSSNPHPPTPSTWVFYIDTAGDFYPPAAAQLGLPLERLLVIRSPRMTDALWVCEQALRCQAIAAVVLPIRTIDAYVSRRLQLAAETGGGLGFLLRSEPRGGHTFAATRLRLDPLPNKNPTPCPDLFTIPPLRGDYRGVRSRAHQGYDPPPTPPYQGGGFSLDSLGATCRARVTLLKLRDGRPAGPFELALPLAPTQPTTRRSPSTRSPRQTRSTRSPGSAVSAS